MTDTQRSRTAGRQAETARGGVLDRARFLVVPDLHRRVQPAVQPGGARDPRRLRAADDLRAEPGAVSRRGRRGAGLAARRSRIRLFLLPLDLRVRPHGARRRTHDLRFRHRLGDHRAGVRGCPADDGLGAAGHLRRLPRLCSVRPAPAHGSRASRLWPRAGGEHAGLRHRRHLRHADLRVVDLHLPVHPVRRLSRAGRDDHAVHRFRAGHRRPHARRPGQGRGDQLRPDGHDQRLRRGQRGHHRPVHHSADEALRLFVGFRRRRRGHRQHGWADHAAGDGRGRLHHGGDDQRPLHRDLQGGGDSGGPLFRHRVLDGAPRSRTQEPARHAEGRMPRPVEGGAPALVPAAAADRAGRAAVLRLHAAVLGYRRARADRHPDLRRGGALRRAQPPAALPVLGAARLRLRRLHRVRRHHLLRDFRGAGRAGLPDAREARRAAAGGRRAGRRRAPCAAGGHCLRAGRA